MQTAVANLRVKTKYVFTRKNKFATAANFFFLCKDIFGFRPCICYRSLHFMWHYLTYLVIVLYLAVFTYPWIVTTTVLLVFFVSHIKLVYLSFFLLFSTFKVSLCTRALVLDVFCVLPCPLDPPLRVRAFFS